MNRTFKESTTLLLKHMREMHNMIAKYKRTIKALTICIACIALYSIAWQFTCYKIKNIVAQEIKSLPTNNDIKNLGIEIKNIKYDDLHVTGFPFNFHINIENLIADIENIDNININGIAIPFKSKSTSTRVDQITISSDILAKHISLSFGKHVKIQIPENKTIIDCYSDNKTILSFDVFRSMTISYIKKDLDIMKDISHIKYSSGPGFTNTIIGEDLIAQKITNAEHINIDARKINEQERNFIFDMQRSYKYEKDKKNIALFEEFKNASNFEIKMKDDASYYMKINNAAIEVDSASINVSGNIEISENYGITNPNNKIKIYLENYQSLLEKIADKNFITKKQSQSMSRVIKKVSTSNEGCKSTLEITPVGNGNIKIGKKTLPEVLALHAFYENEEKLKKKIIDRSVDKLFDIIGK